MKIILGIIVIFISGFIGIILSNKYLYRYNFFNSFLTFNKLLKKELSFNQTTILRLLNENSNDDFNYYLLSKFNNKDTVKINYLKDEEIKFLKEYVGIIGKSDSASQMKYLESCETYLSDKVKEVLDEKNKYKPLFIKLGFLFGLIFFVLII